MPKFKVRMHTQDLLKVKQHMDVSAAFLELQELERENAHTWHPADMLWPIARAILAGRHGAVAPTPKPADLVDVFIDESDG